MANEIIDKVQVGTVTYSVRDDSVKVKDASVSGSTLSITKKDGTTVTFTNHDTTYEASQGIEITSGTSSKYIKVKRADNSGLAVNEDNEISVNTGPGITINSSGQVVANFGSVSGTVCQGNDSRLSDARTPKSHQHGNITNDGKIGTTANLAVVTSTGGAVSTADLTTSDVTSSGTSTSFIKSVTQDSKGKITATKAGLPTASTSTAGIIKIGTAATDAAAGNHTHNYEPTSTAVRHTASTAVGTTNQPVYVDSTGAAKAISYTINKSVPSDAKFTDTTYTAQHGIQITSDNEIKVAEGYGLTTYDGELIVDTSVIATKDDIPTVPTSYITNASVSGKTLTLTKADGSSVTFTDTDTTYTAEKGITLSSGKFGHSNSAVTAVTSPTFLKVKYDAYGHITGTSAVAKTDITSLGIPDNNHNHDSRYYTESEVDTKLSGKSDTGHNHDSTYLKLSGGTLTGQLTTQNIIPNADDGRELGSSTVGWKAVHTHEISGSGGNIIALNGIRPDTTSPKYLGVPDYQWAGIYGTNIYQNGTKVSVEGHTHTWENITNPPASYTPSSHNHDDRYYTESEINTKLSGKSDTSHTHSTAMTPSTSTPVITLVSGATYQLSAGGTSYVFKMPADTNTHLTNSLTIKGNGTEAVKFTQNADKTLNLKGSGATSVSKTADGEITISSTNTTYGVATSSALGLVKSATTGTTSGRDYNVQVNSDGTMKVNVPWTDNNTTYSAGTGLTLSGTTFSVNYGTTSTTACRGDDSRLSDSRNAKDVYSWAKASTKPSYTYGEIGAGTIYNAIIDTHPESSTSTLAYYTNDLVNLIARGGSITAVNKTTGATYDLSGAVNGTPSYSYVSVSAVTDVVEINIVSPVSYSWGTHFGIGFGDARWRAKDVKIETGNGTAWKTIYDVHNSGNPIHDIGGQSGPASSNGSNPWNRIRITLTNFNQTSCRVAGIWTQNYGSNGLALNFLQTAGGTVYGQISASNLLPRTNNTYSLGNSSNQWKEIRGVTIYQNGTQVSNVGHKHDWSDITSGVPATFTPSAHNQSWSTITDKPSTYTPSAHNQSWSTITDKPASYTPSAHNQAWSTITDKPASYTPSAHNHDSLYVSKTTPSMIGPITVGLGGQTDEFLCVDNEGMAAKLHFFHTNGADGNIIVAKTGTIAMLSDLAWGNISDKPSTFTPSSHNHDDRYYTETEMNTKLSGKSDTSHTHNTSIAASTATSQITLTHGSKYAINAGGTSYVFTMPSSGAPSAYLKGAAVNGSTLTLTKQDDSTVTFTNTWRGIQNVLTSDSTTDSLSAAQGKALKALVDGKAASGHTHTTTIAEDTGTNQLSLKASTKYKLTAGGTSFIFTMPGDSNSHRPIQMNGTEILGNNTTALNLNAGSNVTLSNSSGTVTINATDTTYSAATTSADGLMSKTDKSKLDGIATGATKVIESTVSGWGFTKNAGTVTSVAVKMNGSTKGTVTSTGTIDLGTVLTAHQDISGKENTSNKVTSWSSTTTDAHYPSEKLVKTALDGKASSTHDHTLSIAADSGTNQLTLAASTKYKLTAGGKSFIFTTAPNNTYSAGTGLSLSSGEFSVTYGNAANTACQGNDSRLSNSRTPTSHASTATTYGVGTTSNYGHVKTQTGDMNGTSSTNGIAAGLGHTHSQYSTTSHNHDSTYLKLDGTYLKSASISGNTLTITKSDNGTLAITDTWRPIGTGATDAAAGNHNHDSTYLKVSGGTLTGNLNIDGGGIGFIPIENGYGTIGSYEKAFGAVYTNNISGWQGSNISSKSGIKPETTNSKYLGNPTNQWAGVFARELHIDQSNFNNAPINIKYNYDNSYCFEVTNNDYTTHVDFPDSGPSGGVSITFPDSSGTLALTGHTHNWGDINGGSVTAPIAIDTIDAGEPCLYLRHDNDRNNIPFMSVYNDSESSNVRFYAPGYDGDDYDIYFPTASGQVQLQLYRHILTGTVTIGSYSLTFYIQFIAQFDTACTKNNVSLWYNCVRGIGGRADYNSKYGTFNIKPTTNSSNCYYNFDAITPRNSNGNLQGFAYSTNFAWSNCTISDTVSTLLGGV